MPTLIYIELLKLIKRPMTWILFFLQVGFLVVGSTINALSLRNASPEVADQMIRRFVLPDSLPNATQFIYMIGVILLVILTASSIGSEYNWGTLRQTLASGVSRSGFLLARIISLALIAALFVILPLLAIIPFSLVFSHLQQLPTSLGPVDTAWLVALVGRTYLVVFMPMTLAFLIALIARSQSAGVGAALGVLILDQFVSPLLWVLGSDWSLELLQLFPFWAARTILSLNFTEPITDLPDVMDETRALVTLLAYIVICVGAALVVFRRRDVGGAV